MLLNMMINVHTKQMKGFTLLETVVAVSVLMFGVLGPLYLANQSVKAARMQNEHLTAAGLSQEGIEMVRNVVANNTASDGPSNWLDGVTVSGGKCDTPNGCIANILETNNKQILACPAAPGCDKKVYKNPTTGMYGQDKGGLAAPWIITPYSRTITVSTIDAKTIRVTSTVTWGSGRSYALSETVSNWFPYPL